MTHYNPNRAQIHENVGGACKAGSAFVNATPIASPVVLAGASRCRVYWLSDHAGTLNLWAVRPQLAEATAASANRYTTRLGTATVSANAEATIDVDLHGEHAGHIEFIPGANGTVTYCDLARI